MPANDRRLDRLEGTVKAMAWEEFQRIAGPFVEQTMGIVTRALDAHITDAATREAVRSEIRAGFRTLEESRP